MNDQPPPQTKRTSVADLLTQIEELKAQIGQLEIDREKLIGQIAEDSLAKTNLAESACEWLPIDTAPKTEAKPLLGCLVSPYGDHLVRQIAWSDGGWIFWNTGRQPALVAPNVLDLELLLWRPLPQVNVPEDIQKVINLGELVKAADEALFLISDQRTDPCDLGYHGNVVRRERVEKALRTILAKYPNG